MAVEIDKDWRKKEESYWEIKKKYPTVSPFVITQIDVQRRGVEYTDAADGLTYSGTADFTNAKKQITPPAADTT